MVNFTTDLEVCSIWNLSECRWRHLVGGRFSQYHFTSDLYWLWESEVNDFRYSVEEESCTHRQEYAACLDKLNCNNQTMDLYNSTQLARKLFRELHQYNFDFFMQGVPKYIRREWCQYPDPLNKVHSDCVTCFTLLRHLNTTEPGYWNFYLKSIAVLNYRGCVGPHCVIRGTVVPPSFSERLYRQDAERLAEIVAKEKAEKLKSSGSSFRAGVVASWVPVLRYFATFT